MYRLLISTCLVLSVLQEYSTIPSLYNKQYSRTGKYNTNSSQAPAYTGNGKNDGFNNESHVPQRNDGIQEQSYINRNQESELFVREQLKTLKTNRQDKYMNNMNQNGLNQNHTNQSNGRNVHTVDQKKNETGKDRETTSIKNDSILTEKTEMILNANNKTMDLKDKSLNTIQAAYTENIEEKTAENKEMTDIIKSVCGEQYGSCTDTSYGLGMFKHSSTCATCSCDAQTCRISNTCCPDILVDIDNHEDDTQTTKFCAPLSDILDSEQKSRELMENKGLKDTTDKKINNTSSRNDLNELVSSSYSKYIVTKSCPHGFHNTDIKAKCEDKTPAFLMDLIPVSDWLTMGIYWNKWCAQCNNISAIVKWRLVTDCLQLYTIDYLPELVNDFKSLTQNCTLKVVPPKGLDSPACQTYSDVQSFNIITACNVTGLWKENVTMIEQLCKQRNHMPLYKERALGTHRVYKNIFCYTCNTDGTLQTLEAKRKQESRTGSTNEGTRLYLDIKVEDSTEPSSIWFLGHDRHNLTCPHGQIPDLYTEDCIQFECPIYQSSISNICMDRGLDVTGLVLSSNMQLHFHGPVFIGKTKHERNEFGGKLAAAIDQKMQISRGGCDVRHVQMYQSSPLSLQGYVQDMSIVYKIANTETCSVKQIIKIYETLDKEKVNIIFQLDETQTFPIHSQERQFEFFTIALSFKQLKSYENEITVIEKPVTYEIKLKEKFYCPKVFVPQSEYTKFVKKSNQDETKHLHDLKPAELIPICYTQYLEYWLEMVEAKPVKSQAHSLLTHTLSMISTVTSMISIIIVLVTYSLFSELRFVPGKLFMVLCLNLLLAQGFYSFGLDLGVDNIWCQLLGVCIHMLWTATVFSMNCCLWLMLKNLKDPLGSENRQLLQSKSNYQVFKYSSYCYAMSALCVLTNIILSYSVYKDDHYGYGGTLCYINTRQMRLFTFALPVALVMTINFFMFIGIMSSISKMMHMKYDAAIKAQVFIFLKLSTITGFYWSFGFIYEATQMKVFEYLFIIFNGGQGFFLMWSFLFNKRIMGLYKRVYQNLCLKNEEDLTDTST